MDPPLCHGLVVDGASQLNCSIDTGNFRNSSFIPINENAITVVVYNINYNGNGGEGSDKQNGLAGILQLLRLIDADVLLLSEVARGCEDNLNGAKAIAEALEMEFAYGIAFYNFRGNLTECTDGNAILSKYPLSDVEYFQYGKQSWKFSNRAGGRSSISVTVTTPFGMACVHSTHLESGSRDTLFQAAITRGGQAREVSEFANAYATERECVTVIGGDLNSPFKFFDPTFFSLRYNGYFDAHGFLTSSNRTTHEGADDDENAEKYGIACLDYVLVKPKESIVFEYSGICHKEAECHGWSDHVAVWTAIKLEYEADASIEYNVFELSDRIGASLKATVDWSFIYFPLLWAFILMHFIWFLYVLRKFTYKEKAYMLDWQSRLQSDYVVLLSAQMLSFSALLTAIVHTATGIADYARDFSSWSLFLFTGLLSTVLILRKITYDNPDAANIFLIVLYDTCLVTCVFASVIFWFLFFWPTCACSSNLCGNRFRYPDFVMHLVNPFLLISLSRRYAIPIRTLNPCPGFGASTILVVFLTFDYLIYFEREVPTSIYLNGFSYFAIGPGSLLAIFAAVLLVLVQFILGVLLRIISDRSAIIEIETEGRILKT